MPQLHFNPKVNNWPLMKNPPAASSLKQEQGKEKEKKKKS